MYPGTVFLKLDGVHNFLTTGTIRDIDIIVLLSFFLIGSVIKVCMVLGYFCDCFARRHGVNGSLYQELDLMGLNDFQMVNIS